MPMAMNPSRALFCARNRIYHYLSYAKQQVAKPLARPARLEEGGRGGVSHLRVPRILTYVKREVVPLVNPWQPIFASPMRSNRWPFQHLPLKLREVAPNWSNWRWMQYSMLLSCFLSPKRASCAYLPFSWRIPIRGIMPTHEPAALPKGSEGGCTHYCICLRLRMGYGRPAV
jgi:hypothetical protein